MTGRPFVDEPREQRCAANLVRAANALLARNICPPCITQVDPAMVAMANEQTIDAATGLVACAGTTPIGGDEADFVAPDKATGLCEVSRGRPSNPR